MADRWYYAQGGKVLGPVSAGRVRQLLAAGELTPEAEVWGETSERRHAAEVRKASEVAGQAAVAAAVPDWLGDVARAEGVAPSADPPPLEGEFEWLADVEIPAASAESELLPLTAAGPVRVVLGGATSRGRVRPRNEDRFLIQQLAWSDDEDCHELALVVLADGMGGHQAGDRASSLAVRTVGGVLAPVLVGILQGPNREAGVSVLTRHLDKALQDAHAAVSKRSETDPACKGMGATAAVVLVWNELAFLRHVGDCRIYHQRGGELRQLTRDQTLVGRMVELGQLKPHEAEKHPARGEVTQALGKRGVLEPSQQTLTLEAGDRLVVACDGLSAHVDEPTLAETVTGWTGSPIDLASKLVDLANEGGGSDNCTVVVVACG